MHLLTREAMEVYHDHLEPNGIHAFHISNNYVDLEPVLANLAADRRCVAYIRQHEPTQQEKDDGIMASPTGSSSPGNPPTSSRCRKHRLAARPTSARFAGVDR